MATSKKPTKSKSKDGKTHTSSSGKSATKRARKAKKTKASKSKAAASSQIELHPRLRGQSLQSERSTFPDDFHALYDRGFRASRGISSPSTESVQLGSRRLAKEVKDIAVHYDDVTQLPNLVLASKPSKRLSRRSVDSPESAVTDFIRANSDLWNLTAADAQTIEVVSLSQTRVDSPAEPQRRRGARKAQSTESKMDQTNLKTVNMIQRVDGKEVFNSEVTAAVNSKNEVLCVAGQFFSGTENSISSRVSARGRRAAKAPTAASAEEAIVRATFDLTSFEYEASDFKLITQSADSGPYRFYQHQTKDNDPRPVFTQPIRVKEVMFPLSGGDLTPAYYIELWLKGFPAYSYVMDTLETPDLLYRKNLTSHVSFSYRVHNTNDAVLRPHDGPAPGTPHPKGKPNGFQAKTIAEKLIKVESLLPGDPWLAPNAITTDGNNCIAYADLTEPDGFNAGDVMGKVSAPQTFDYKYKHTKPASDPTNLQNSLVGMFFHVNWLHDRWYEAGFDEASGNAQKNNFGRGGVGGDPILAEGNDSSGTDNANMSTPADGASPIMQMYEFVGPDPLPSRTSNHEALITFHEMGHYVTNRLVGNANGLTNVQGRAMGEGWGDFFAICMTSQATDNFATGAFAAGGWTDLTSTFNDNYYFSIRRYPYSADMAKNPLTFKHIGNNVVLPTGPPINASGAGNNEFHNAGEVWCAMLWEVFVGLVNKHGHAEAEKRMLAYVIGGLKLTPLRPTFTQAKDGILASVSALNAGDLSIVKAGFAKRGIGKDAQRRHHPTQRRWLEWWRALSFRSKM